MCGIFAYFGQKENPLEMVVHGLKKLEYRGYDSWGIALKSDHDFIIHKEVGKIGEFLISDIEKIFPSVKYQVPSTKYHIAIGHSRWATHGGVTEYNAHPHWSENKEIIICHNGIFENYQEIKQQLIEKGYTFRSETDTEVLVHLIQSYLHENDFETSVKKALSQIEGRYAIIALSKDEDKIIAARRGSPLIVGIGNDEYFIASDIPAFLEYTDQVQYLDDNQMVIITNEGPRYEDMTTHQTIEKRIIKIEWQTEEANKGDFSHFMIKEIMEQKESLYRAINQDEQKLYQAVQAIKSAYGTFFIGCGTAFKVCLTAEYLFSKIAKRHINVLPGSEFKFHEHFLTDKSLLIAVSQSGETADTLEAIESIKKKAGKVISIINNETSTMARYSDIILPIKAGPEKAVASTKATTAQLAVCTMLAYAMVDKLHEGKQLLIETASQINDMLNPRYENHILCLSERIRDFESMYIIGRGLNYPMALEAAIKLQEVSYIHAEGFAGGELKHGPIALISQGTPCIVLVANDESKNEILSNAMEVKARGGYIIGISPENAEVFDYWIRVPDSGNASPIVNIIPIQILAYQLALIKQNNPDMPRNLAKSVTVK